MLLVLAAVVTMAWGHGGGQSSGATVTVAAHDVPAGQHVAAEDLTEVPATHQWQELGHQQPVPTSQLVGRTLAVPLRAGDQVTPRMVVGQDLTEGLGAGRSVVGVRVRDPETVQLFAPGSRVTAMGRTAEGEPVESSGTLIWAPPQQKTGSGGTGLGGTRSTPEGTEDTVLLAVPAEQAAQLAGIDGRAMLVASGRDPDQ